MRLSDLKTGMWIKTRIGNMYLVLKDYETINYGSGVFANVDGFLTFEHYTNDLRDTEDDGYDIIEIFKPDGDMFILNSDVLISIWKRRQEPELTSFEKEFLKALKPDYRNGWIARDNNGLLYVYDSEPIKGKEKWAGVEYHEVGCSSILSTDQFAWCKWEDEEPWFIPDLLKEA